MKRILILALLFTHSALFAQVGKKYPSMSGENLLRKNVSVPPSNGKVTLVALAYSEKSEEDLKAWRQPLFDLFIQAPGTQIFEFDPYDANVKFVVLLTGINKVAAGKVKSKLEDNVKEHWKEHIVVVKGKTIDNYTELDLERGKAGKSKPYFYLLDKTGKIVYATSGAYTRQKQEELETHLQQLLGDNQFKDK
jgi:ATP10 protein